MGTIADPTIKIRPSKNMEDFITHIKKDLIVEAPPGIQNMLLDSAEVAGDRVLSLSDIEWLQEHLHQTQASCYLHELLKGSRVLLPEPKVLVRNPELEARIQRLKREQEARDYRQMTRNVDATRVFEPQETLAYQIKQINRQLIAVAQFIFSVAAGFAFGFIGIELLVGDLDFGFRLLLGVMFALIVALAEIYFLAKKLSEEYIQGDQPKPHQE